ncbi:MAG: hypothetical protein LQ344_004520 [Seirophora lacunosa]|nr:MAG: hypothetical protein LQ344_004520 [Seirophora lacunosa]
MQSFHRATRAQAFFRLARLAPAPPRRHASSSFSQGPAPPRLPKEDQELYEKLQRSSTGAFSTPNPTVVINPTAAVSSPPEPSSRTSSFRPQINQSPHSSSQTKDADAAERTVAVDARVKATGKGEELHPDVRRGARPEFEGERNPKTGEVGGPKNEPLRWGGGVDWSYNGRVTDF